MRYENHNPWFEWAYQDIKAKLLLEKYVKDADGNPPTNYLFYTFHGEVKYIIIFGEMTNYPGAGRSPAFSLEFDVVSSAYWKQFDGY